MEQSKIIDTLETYHCSGVPAQAEKEGKCCHAPEKEAECPDHSPEEEAECPDSPEEEEEAEASSSEG